MSQSDVSYLRQQIALTCEAMQQALHGYAVTAHHAIISAKYRQLAEQQEQLARHVGEDEALAMICQVMNQVITRSA